MSFLTFENLGLAFAVVVATGCSDDQQLIGGGGSTGTTTSSSNGGSGGQGGSGAGGASTGGGETGGAGGFEANGFCSDDGWCWENPLPQGHALNDVWASGGEAIAVGDYGTILRFDGNGWTRDELPDFVFPRFTAVWGASIDDVFAVGDGVFRNDGSGWVELATPITNDLNAIWGETASSLWVAGDLGALYHFDGTDWVFEGSGTPSFGGLSGTSSSDVWAITDAEIWHRDATGWTSIAIDSLSPEPSGTLTSIWAVASDDVWAVGTNGMLLHYDGSWSVEAPLGDEDLLDVWAAGADDVYVIIDEVSFNQPNTAHWDGSSWQLEVLVDDNPPSALAGSSPSDIWMVGRHGQLRRYDGATASDVSRDLLSGSAESGVWANDVDDVWIVGNNQALHFDGVDWQRHSLEGDDPTAIWSSGPNHAVVVGETGHISQWDGVSWSTLTAQPSVDLFAVWGSGPSDVFAAGADGVILHYDGDTWSGQVSGTNASIASVWGSSGDDVYAVAPPSTVLHYAAGAWAPIDVGPIGAVFGVGGTSATDVNVVGDGIRHFDGNGWSDDNAAGGSLRAYFATSATDRWAVGSNIQHDDGSGWVTHTSGTNSFLFDVSGAGGQVWVAGDDHTLLRHTR